MSVQKIEAAAKELPSAELDQLVGRLSDFIQDSWDRQMKEDAESGRLDTLLDEAREDIRQGRTRPL